MHASLLLGTFTSFCQMQMVNILQGLDCNFWFMKPWLVKVEIFKLTNNSFSTQMLLLLHNASSIERKKDFVKYSKQSVYPFKL